MTGQPQSPLERTLARALRELPARHAPVDLAQQVLHRIAQREAGRGIASWSARARTLFFGVCALLAALLIVQPYPLGSWTAPLRAALARSIAPIHDGAQPLFALYRAAGIVRDSLPTGLIEDGLAAGAVFYVALFGLAAMAYRLYAGAARREELPHG